MTEESKALLAQLKALEAKNPPDEIPSDIANMSPHELLTELAKIREKDKSRNTKEDEETADLMQSFKDVGQIMLLLSKNSRQSPLGDSFHTSTLNLTARHIYNALRYADSDISFIGPKSKIALKGVFKLIQTGVNQNLLDPSYKPNTPPDAPTLAELSTEVQAKYPNSVPG